MRESKYQLQRWKNWKQIIILLKETKDDLKTPNMGIRYDADNIPGGNHKTIHEKYEKMMQDSATYDDLIHKYEFFVNRLEKAVNTLLTNEERTIILIYSSYDNAKQREIEALYNGYSRTNFYRILEVAFDKLDAVIDPVKIGTNLGLKHAENVQ